MLDVRPDTAVLVRADAALAQLNAAEPSKPAGAPSGATGLGETVGLLLPETPPAPVKPKRFFGTVEIDMVRPVKDHVVTSAI